MDVVYEAYDNEDTIPPKKALGISDRVQIQVEWCDRWAAPTWRKMGEPHPATGGKGRASGNCRMFPCCGFSDKAEEPILASMRLIGKASQPNTQ